MTDNYQVYKQAALLTKYLKGELSASEETELKQWLTTDPKNSALLKQLLEEKEDNAANHFFKSIDTESAWKNIINRKQNYQSSKNHFLPIWRFVAIVAVILGFGVKFYLQQVPPQKEKKLASILKNAIKPSENKAMLTLADGSVVVLDDARIQTVNKQRGIKILNQNGRLIYQVIPDHNSTEKVEYNTISTPQGGQYEVILPDKSGVWLNAASSLKYPVTFKGTERKVFLTGEAYFEVSKNPKLPFKVIADNTEVMVFGTHFNVMAYSNEPFLKTTLLEGSVKITTDKQSKMLTPGEQVSISSTNHVLNISEADLIQTMAWKNGLFNFNNDDIRNVMRQIARWYNVEVAYQDKITTAHFSGTISRNNQLAQILKMLELTGGVHFKIEGKRITILK